MNKVCLLGRLTKEIELRYTQSQKAFTQFTVAVNRRGKDAGTDFITCIAWDKTAEFMQKYCTKGMQVAITGRIQTGQYDDKDGKRVYTTDVVVEDITPIWNSKGDDDISVGSSFNGATKKEDPPITDDDLPF